jgi:tRNA-splicing ligase RtcB
MAMPDCHYGYGFPIGGVAAFDTSDGIISPGGVGYDINCGVRLLRTNLTDDDVRHRLDALADRIFANVPAGVGGKSELRLSEDELARALTRGAAWAVAQGLGNDDDLEKPSSVGDHNWAPSAPETTSSKSSA